MCDVTYMKGTHVQDAEVKVLISLQFFALHREAPGAKPQKSRWKLTKVRGP